MNILHTSPAKMTLTSSRAGLARRAYRCRDAGLEQMQAPVETKRLEGLRQIVGALPEMRPALVVDRNNRGIGKRGRGLDRVVRIHRQVKRPARLRRAGKQQHNAGLEAARNLGHAIVPDGVAGYVDGRETAAREHETDDVARQWLDAGGAVARRRGGDRNRR